MEIRLEADDDAVAIHGVLRDAFPTDAEARLVGALRASGKLLLSLVAEIEGQIVGHIAFSPISLDPPRTDIVLWGLAPLAVLPEVQRTGIGSQLTWRALEICRERAISGVVVLGHPEFYSRFGFQPASKFGLRDEYGGGDAFMMVDLTEPNDAGLPECQMNALARYSTEFADL